jgi:uncharacterized 2Fe-2S/4Fe-4S cluster protein (DUF4445 family)
MTEKANITLTVLPDDRTLALESSVNLMDALRDAGILLTAPCAGQGTCGKCLVQVESKSPLDEKMAVSQPCTVGSRTAPTIMEYELLTAAQLEKGFRLACQMQVYANATVKIPVTSRAAEMRVLLGGLSRKVALEPSIVKRFVQAPQQQLERAVSELDLLKSILNLRADLRADYAVVRELPLRLYEANRQLTVVACGERIIALEPGNTADQAYGLALDVGTTTVVGALIDLATGKELAVASAVNGQTQFGHDVIARIKFSTENPNGLTTLQNAVKKTVNHIVAKVCESAQVSPERIYEATIVGNTTMSHLLLGVSPQSLGHLPYAPVFSAGLNLDAATIGFNINPRANIYVLPNIAGFVGADTVGAILAASFDEPDGRIRMLADIGTNCEIVLRYGDDLLACSTPAGPAFEGAKIHHGMMASAGAIEKVYLDDDGNCIYKVIGDQTPQGLCGSGLVDIGAELLRVGIVDAAGRMLPLVELPESLLATLRERVIAQNGALEFVIVASRNDAPITLTQRDMRELQLAKAAIRTGIDVLLQYAGLSVSDLNELCIAGGFGSYLNKANAIRLGLIPDMPRNRIRIIGNAAIGGAKLALISQQMRRRAEIVARRAKHLQIAETPDFQTQFMEAMMFEESRE